MRDATERVVGAAHILRAQFAGLPLPYAVIERGPVVADPAMFGPVMSRLARAARWRGIARLAVMPYWELTAGAAVRATLDELGWRSVQKMSGAHAATLRLALGRERSTRADGAAEDPDGSAALDTIFAGSEFRKLRQQYRYAERAGVRARRGTAADLPRFVALYRELDETSRACTRNPTRGSTRWRRSTSEPNGSVGLFFTEHESDTVAGALTIRHGRLVTLYLAASARAPRKFSKMVTCLVAAVAWAQRDRLRLRPGRRADDRRHRREAAVDRAVQARLLDDALRPDRRARALAVGRDSLPAGIAVCAASWRFLRPARLEPAVNLLVALAHVRLGEAAPDRRARSLAPPRHLAAPERGRRAQRRGQRLRREIRASQPVSPSATISGTPPTGTAITGRPSAIASSKPTGSPSVRELQSTASSSAMIVSGSLR